MSGGNTRKKAADHPYRDFGADLGRLRYTAHVTQEVVAKHVAVSPMTVRNWESGRFKPTIKNLQQVIEFYVQKGAFSPGKEREEIRELWEKFERFDLRATLDEEWLEQLPIGDAVHLSSVSREYALGEGEHGEAIPIDLFDAQSLLRDRNRWRMLQRVHTMWIEGYLRRSLYRVKPLSLTLREQPDAVMPLWESIAQVSEQPSHPPVALTSIERIFREAEGRLLILGDSGSGKSTLLLELTSALLRRAALDEAQPIPVIFNLSSWQVRSQSLAAWLVEQLCETYQVNRHVGRQWVEKNRLLLLLDGLDESPRDNWSACIHAINEYCEQHVQVSVVVCARRVEYMSVPEQLHLQQAVVVQPLTPRQIEDYLAEKATHFVEMRRVLREDKELLELVSTPRMLSIVARAYRGRPATDLPRSGSLEDRRERILAAYLQHMLQRKRPESTYTKEQMLHWLKWLAGQLERRGQSVFYIEGLQMDWLPDPYRYRGFPLLAMACVYGLILALVKGIDYMLVFSGKGVPGAVPKGALDGLLIGVFTALVYVVLNLLCSLNARQRQEGQATQHIGFSIKGMLRSNLAYGVLFGALMGLFIGFFVDPPAGLDNGLFLSMFFFFLGRFDPLIRPAEVITWSWAGVIRNGWKLCGLSLLVGLVFGVFTGEPYLPNLAKMLPYLLFGLSIGLVTGVLIGLAMGLSHNNLDNQKTVKPNQGIWNSLRNSLLLASVCGIIFGIVFGLIFWVVRDLVFGVGSHTLFPSNSGLAFGVQDGLALAAFFWLRSGGTTCVQYGLLRVLLWKEGCIPWNYARFLDDVSWRDIFQKVGGGYTIHQLLLQHLVHFDPS